MTPYLVAPLPAPVGRHTRHNHRVTSNLDESFVIERYSFLDRGLVAGCVEVHSIMDAVIVAETVQTVKWHGAPLGVGGALLCLPGAGARDSAYDPSL